MKPREQLERESRIILHGTCRDRHGAANAISQNLKNYAIGRWVSVEERLPKKQGFYRIKWSDGLDDPELSHSWFCLGNPDARTEERKQSMFTSMRQGATITHWLDLDLPSGKGEA